MSEPDQALATEAEDSGAPAKQDEHASAMNRRKQTIRFIVLFVVYVLSLLLGYRYVIDSEANMRYLYFVAKHTSLILDVVGADSSLEPGRLAMNLDRIQGELDAMRAGMDLQAIRRTNGNSWPKSAEDRPVTAWESWVHRAYVLKSLGQSLADDGPFVKFTATEGFSSRERVLRKNMRLVRRDATLDPEAQKERIAQLQAQIDALVQEKNQIPAGPERTRAAKDKFFNFRLVPDCGAIPSISIFVAAILAFPTSWRKRLLGVIAGVPALYCVNLLRVATLAYIGAIDPTEDNRWFSFFHEFVWQGVFIIFVVVAWMIWMELIVRKVET